MRPINRFNGTLMLPYINKYLFYCYEDCLYVIVFCLVISNLSDVNHIYCF